ncbi:hypothetical protein [Brevundimonas denitrificans]|nr:hypothetical protein [Brevundimonas denitrificans]
MMSFLRRDLFPLTAALLAALAVLFVSTASTACEAPISQGMAAMSMSDASGPCEPESGVIPCRKACLASCQSLIPQGGGSTLARTFVSVRYPSLVARRADFTPEADDPPPRT